MKTPLHVPLADGPNWPVPKLAEKIVTIKRFRIHSHSQRLRCTACATWHACTAKRYHGHMSAAGSEHHNMIGHEWPAS